MKTPKFIKNFLKCGLIGWCMEIIFTAAGSLRRRDYTLKGTTSLWMFPIYGCASFLAPLYRLLHSKAIWIRGLIYTCLIFLMEFISGTYLRKKELCPWNYNRSKWNIGKIIRLDYAPLWFLAGLFFEQTLTHNAPKTTPDSKPLLCKKAGPSH